MRCVLNFLTKMQIKLCVLIVYNCRVVFFFFFIVQEVCVRILFQVGDVVKKVLAVLSNRVYKFKIVTNVLIM